MAEVVLHVLSDGCFGNLQRRLLCFVLDLQVSSALKQLNANVRVVFLKGQMQWRVAFAILKVNVRAERAGIKQKCH